MRLFRWFKTHRYCLALGYFVFYLIAFTLLERREVPSHIIHIALDDHIPFNEWFILPYLAWLVWMPGMLLYFLLKSREDFLRLCFLMFTGMTICLLIYTVFPNAVNLRQPIEGENPLCHAVEFLRRIDTSTNVCPSIHVSSTAAIQMVIHRSALFRDKPARKRISGVLSLFICLSTLFLQQHSVVDLLCGLALSWVLYGVAYHPGFSKAVSFLRMREYFARKKYEAE